MVLRNVVPRQGTETILLYRMFHRLLLRNVVPRQGTETLNGFLMMFHPCIEKCSSPTGDGNYIVIILEGGTKQLRNVVPRQGTETPYVSLNLK